MAKGAGNATRQLQLIIEAQNRTQAALGQVTQQLTAMEKVTQTVGNHFKGNFTRSLDDVQKGFQKINAPAEKFNTIATRMALRVAGVMIPMMILRDLIRSIERTLGDAAKSVWDTGTAFEALQVRMIPILVTQKAVQEQFAAISQQFSQSPHNILDVTQAFVTLEQHGMKPNARALKVLGDYATYTGQKISEVSQQLLGVPWQFRMNTLARMEAMASGSSERAYQTPAGRLEAVRNTFTAIALEIYSKIEKPLLNVIEAFRRFLNGLLQSGVFDKIGETIAKWFKVENIKKFGETLINVFFTVKDILSNFFAQVAQLFKVIDLKVRQWATFGLALFHQQGMDFSGAKQLAIEARGYRIASEKERAKFEYMQAHPTSDIAGRNKTLAAFEKILSGFTDKAVKIKSAAGPNRPYDVFKATDPITAMILGGGLRAGIGVNASQMGSSFNFLRGHRPIVVDVTGAEGHFKAAMTTVAKGVLVEAVRGGFLLVPGAH